MLKLILIYIIISVSFGWYNEWYYDINRDVGKHNWLMISIFYILICWLIIPIYGFIRIKKWFFRGY